MRPPVIKKILQKNKNEKFPLYFTKIHDHPQQYFARKLQMLQNMMFATIIITLAACSSPIHWEELWQKVQLEVAKPPVQDASTFDQFSQDWQSLLEHPQWSISGFNQKQAEVIIQAIARYQLYYFIEPDTTAMEKLPQMWEIWDECIRKYPALNKNTDEAQKLRHLLQIVQHRNQQTHIALQQLLLYWQQQPQQWKELLTQLSVSWEIGGVIYYRKSKAIEPRDVAQTKQEQIVNTIEVVQIADLQRVENAQYLAEFRNNDFRNLNILEQRFIQRLELFQVAANSSTQLYTQVVIRAAHQRFALLRSLGHPQNWNEEQQQIAQQAKKKLYFFGLEKRLLNRTYFFDKEKYMTDPEACFFFHSHPYDAKIPYLKLPSKQDKISTFRIGPSLVFDVQKNFVDLYCVVAGEVKKIQRFDYEMVEE